MIKGKLKNMITLRSDLLYCPLALSVDSYSNCDTDCVTCYLRRLNYTWDRDNRPMDTELFYNKLTHGLSNPKPQSPLAWALKQKKVIRFGNKSDPFQNREVKEKVSLEALQILADLKWPTVIQTKFLLNMTGCMSVLEKMKDHLWIMPVMSPGMDRDWETFERSIPTPPMERVNIASRLRKEWFQVGFNGEPFIPGWNTVREFEDTICILKAAGINRYNTYNFHFNEFVAKRLHAIGVDIEKIWYMNQDAQWQPIQSKLIELAKKHGIILGCPDFVNSGSYLQPNTCCGLDVSNPLTYNIHTWKNRLLRIPSYQRDKAKPLILKNTWDKVGDIEEGKNAMFYKSPDRFTMEDVKW